MSADPDWPTAFVAFGALLGEPVDVLRAALGDGATAQADALAASLARLDRDARARALAAIVTLVAEGLDAPAAPDAPEGAA